MLILDPDALAVIRRHAQECYPNEACGLLIGKGGLDCRIAMSAQSARNRNADKPQERYDLHPLDYQRIDQEARSQGLDVIGIYHSHPDRPPQPSKVDQEHAWEGYSYVIVEVSEGPGGEARSFEMVDEALEEEELRIGAEEQ
jgi:proteasome lid subunit RPN8/RPN11